MSSPQRRATLIFQVRSGQLTAQQAAQQLGISRQAYYQWEQRGLKALLLALEDQPKGRPKGKSDPEKHSLLCRVKELEQTVQALQQKELLRNKLKDLRAAPGCKKNSL